jgi:hypothetical protein
MIGVEDDSEGGEEKHSGRSRKPQKGKKEKMGGRDVVGPLRNMMMAGESRKSMTTAAEDIKVGDPARVSRAGLRNGGKSEGLQFRSRQYGLKILQDKNVLYDSLLF